MVRSDSSGIPLPREEMPDWLLPLRNAFLASLLSLGLKTGTVRNYAPAVDWLCAEAGRRGLTTPDGVDGSVLAQVLEPLPARLSVRSGRIWASVLGRFIAWLVKVIVLRYGSVNLYRRTQGVFLGMIAGQMLTMGLWLIIDYFTGKTNNWVFGWG